MTEAEWLACDDPEKMLAYLQPRASERKLRFFVCACFRQRWDSLDERRKAIVETGESYADGLADSKTVKQAQQQALASEALQATWLAVSGDLFGAIRSVMTHEFWLLQERLEPHCLLFRDIFGNPFRPVTLDPGWRTADVVALAKGIYEERAFDRMPILADALQDAGCENADILEHCRGSGPHVRGCWVVDLILGRA